MFPGFPGRYVFREKRKPLDCITRVRSRTADNAWAKNTVFIEERNGGPGYWLWVSLRRETLPEDLQAIIRAVNRELRAGAPLVECPGCMALRDWLEEQVPEVLAEFDAEIARRGRSRPDRAK
jgi:hypothetical protein